MILGAIVINVSFQFLAPENPQDRARLLFYAVLLLLLAVGLRNWWRLGAVLGGVVALGVVTQAIVDAVAPTWTGGRVIEAVGSGASSSTGCSSRRGTAGSATSRTSRSSPPS